MQNKTITQIYEEKIAESRKASDQIQKQIAGLQRSLAKHRETELVYRNALVAVTHSPDQVAKVNEVSPIPGIDAELAREVTAKRPATTPAKTNLGFNFTA